MRPPRWFPVRSLLAAANRCGSWTSRKGPLAQLVEQWILNPLAPGSSPGWPTNDCGRFAISRRMSWRRVSVSAIAKCVSRLTRAQGDGPAGGRQPAATED